MTTIIDVKQLTKQYKTYKRTAGFKAAVKSIFHRDKVLLDAVKKISFSISAGEIVGFIGPNGAGKSTTIKMLSGVLYPTSGSVSVLSYTPWLDRKRYVKHIGVVFGQKSQLWLDLPPLDSFYLAKDLYGVSDKDFRERLDIMVSLLRIEKVMQRPTRDLSLGERMKCEFVMALLHNPAVLFLDEPTIGVDALAKEDIREFLLHINKRFNTTILLTTHDMDDIEALCDRVIIIDEGAIIYDGNLQKVKKQYVKTKTVDLEFSAIKKKKQFDALVKKGRVFERRSHFLSIEFNERVDVPASIAQFMRICDVTDLNVREPQLEDVIREIYKGR